MSRKCFSKQNFSALADSSDSDEDQKVSSSEQSVQITEHVGPAVVTSDNSKGWKTSERPRRPPTMKSGGGGRGRGRGRDNGSMRNRENLRKEYVSLNAMSAKQKVPEIILANGCNAVTCTQTFEDIFSVLEPTNPAAARLMEVITANYLHEIFSSPSLVKFLEKMQEGDGYPALHHVNWPAFVKRPLAGFSRGPSDACEMVKVLYRAGYTPLQLNDKKENTITSLIAARKSSYVTESTFAALHEMYTNPPENVLQLCCDEYVKKLLDTPTDQYVRNVIFWIATLDMQMLVNTVAWNFVKNYGMSRLTGSVYEHDMNELIKCIRGKVPTASVDFALFFQTHPIDSVAMLEELGKCARLVDYSVPTERFFKTCCTGQLNKLSSANIAKFRSVVCWLLSINVDEIVNIIAWQCLKTFDSTKRNGVFPTVKQTIGVIKECIRYGPNTREPDCARMFEHIDWNSRVILDKFNEKMFELAVSTQPAKLDARYYCPAVLGALVAESNNSDLQVEYMMFCLSKPSRQDHPMFAVCIAHNPIVSQALLDEIVKVYKTVGFDAWVTFTLIDVLTTLSTSPTTSSLDIGKVIRCLSGLPDEVEVQLADSIGVDNAEECTYQADDSDYDDKYHEYRMDISFKSVKGLKEIKEIGETTLAIVNGRFRNEHLEQFKECLSREITDASSEEKDAMYESLILAACSNLGCGAQVMAMNAVIKFLETQHVIDGTSYKSTIANLESDVEGVSSFLDKPKPTTGLLLREFSSVDFEVV
jgi:hypothetical protein